MAESNEKFTFIWKIKKFTFFLNKTFLESPIFCIELLNKSKWQLRLFSNVFDGSFRCYLVEITGCPNNYVLDYELSYLANDGSVLHSEKHFQKAIRKRLSHEKPFLSIERNELFLKKKDFFIHDDTLVIRFRIWETAKTISQSVSCFAETILETEHKTFIGVIKQFSKIGEKSKNSIYFESPIAKTFLSSMAVCVVTNSKLAVEIQLLDTFIQRYKCIIFIRDIHGIKMESGLNIYSFGKSCINLTFSKDYIMKNKNLYLQEDALIIECEITYSTNNTKVQSNEPKYEFDNKLTQEITSTMKVNFSTKEDYIEKLTTLMDDLTSLLNEGILYDTKLKTATETFPAHTLILSARSSVFKSMFTIDMKEKARNCVDIDDLDADTVRRMLKFMYTDNLDDLQHESAKNLYFAADKYDIISLRLRCSNFLKQNLQRTNCCDILLLADAHQDHDLKNAVQVYIAENDEAVLFSDEWKSLEKNRPQLTIEVLRSVYMRNRKS